MKIKYFTHGDGPIYGPIADELVAKVSKLGGSITNIPSSVVSYPHYWVKAYLWDMVGNDVDAIVWLDGDIIAHRLPNWDDFSWFAGRQDCASTVKQERETHVVFNSMQYYVNLGVFFADRSSRPLFDLCKQRIRDKIHGNCIEQTWFNYYLNKLQGINHQLIYLGTEDNWFRRAEERPKELYFEHLANYRGIDKLLAFEGRIL